MGKRKKQNSLLEDLVKPIVLIVVFLAFINPKGAKVFTDLLVTILIYGSGLGFLVFLVYSFLIKGHQNISSSSNYKFINSEPKDSLSDNIQCSTELFSPEKETAEIEFNLELLRKIEWKRFEEVCNNFFNLAGYRAKVTGTGADGGKDIILYRKESNDPLAVAQCKAWSNKVGVKPIRELYGIMAAEKIKNGFFMITGEFTEEAKSFAKDIKVKLIDGNQLIQFIKKLPKPKQDQLLKITIAGDYTTPTCPTCGTKMLSRTSNKGSNIGSKFWGCINYPKCKYTLRMNVY